MEQEQLTPNLILNYIEENNIQGKNLIAVECHFTFYGKHGSGFITIKKLDSEWPSFAMIESNSDLHDSFCDQLEENWDEIVKHVREYCKTWKNNNTDDIDSEQCSTQPRIKVEHAKIGTPVTVYFESGLQHAGFITSKPFETDDLVCHVSDLTDPVPLDFITPREIIVKPQF